MSKGSKPRPSSVTADEYASRFDAIDWGRKVPSKTAENKPVHSTTKKDEQDQGVRKVQDSTSAQEA